ncbi:uncharacterized protein CIMG_13155 [Coccidioides immitis RS]|uniref:Uncharacterized protein n=1 Tax=Coccidioides immitis (strain RS) TaxID=246410 RepID=A0A0D8JUW1_COCIM|nr:uncharacterized protein CIMG_13155 [Coccidioides immitis RS]KJF60706.1 hypothetical protein CIMG_13155 [Coccidioides immitis RS]
MLLHLTVCWEKTLGTKFRISCLALLRNLRRIHWHACPRSHDYRRELPIRQGMPDLSIQEQGDFWIPLIAVSSATLIIELVTVVYCLYMILKPLYQDWKQGTVNHARSGSSFDTSRRLTARAASRRVQRILQLQLRAIAVVSLILLHVALLSAIFIQVAYLYDASAMDMLP